MIRTLLVITGASLVLAIVCLGGAAALGGKDLAREGWSWTFHDGDGEGVHFERSIARETEREVTRTIAWTGADALETRMPVDLTYVQGSAAGIVVTGPESLVNRIRVDGGVIRLEDGDEADSVHFALRHGELEAWTDEDRVRITVTAPAVNRFALQGSGDLSLEGYDQDSLTVTIAGSGDVSGEGRAGRLTLDISGSGTADLSRLQTTDADVNLSGSGEARVAPSGAADIDIAGSGEVFLTRRPASLNTDVSGSGEVHQE